MNDELLASFVNVVYDELDGFSSMYCVCEVMIVLTTRQVNRGDNSAL